MKRRKQQKKLSGVTGLTAVEKFNAISKAEVAKILKENGKPNGKLVFYCTRNVE